MSTSTQITELKTKKYLFLHKFYSQCSDENIVHMKHSNLDLVLLYTEQLLKEPNLNTHRNCFNNHQVYSKMNINHIQDHRNIQNNQLQAQILQNQQAIQVRIQIKQKFLLKDSIYITKLIFIPWIHQNKLLKQNLLFLLQSQ